MKNEKQMTITGEKSGITGEVVSISPSPNLEEVSWLRRFIFRIPKKFPYLKCTLINASEGHPPFDWSLETWMVKYIDGTTLKFPGSLVEGSVEILHLSTVTMITLKIASDEAVESPPPH